MLQQIDRLLRHLQKQVVFLLKDIFWMLSKNRFFRFGYCKKRNIEV